ncbi:STY0301 family protein [Brucellaceae bacterium C25G]
MNKFFYISSILITIYFKLTLQSYADNEDTNYKCPSSITLNDYVYFLSSMNVFDGPLEEMAELKPEIFKDNSAIWKNKKMDINFFVKCNYNGIQHYIVFKAKSVNSCHFTPKKHRNSAEGYCRS